MRREAFEFRNYHKKTFYLGTGSADRLVGLSGELTLQKGCLCL